MLPLLLDVNALVALAWPNHQFHAAIYRRLNNEQDRWATCTITQLGFLRLSLTPAVVGGKKSMSEASAVLDALMSDSGHRFLSDLPSPASATARKWTRLCAGPKQLADLYLLAVAELHSAKLLTFDAAILAHGSPSIVELLAAP